MQLSLRKRVLGWLVAINLAVVGAESLVLARQVARRSRSETLSLAEELVYNLRDKLARDTSGARESLGAEFERILRDDSAQRRNLSSSSLAWRVAGSLLEPARPLASAEGRADAAHLAGLLLVARVARQAALSSVLAGPLGDGLVELEGDDDRRAAAALAARAAARLLPSGGLNVGPLLSWPSWERFSDAILLDRNLRRNAQGEWEPAGIALNPVGRAARRPDLDQQEVYAAIADTLSGGQPIENVQGGQVVPIRGDDGLFGACWYVVREPLPTRTLLLRFVLPIFLFSTLVLSLGTFVALRRFVLDPVASLARAARSMAAGERAVRVRPLAREDEVSDLIRAFNEMSGRVESFNEELAAEVKIATEAARRAEAAAMTQRRLAAMGELAAGIAHEINNPLGGLMNAVEVLERPELDDAKRRRYLTLLASGLERIRLTVGQLLRFTPRNARPGPVAVAQAVLDALALVRHRAEKSGVALWVRAGGERVLLGQVEGPFRERLEGLPWVRGESHELAQAVLNLLVNALDALEERTPGSASAPSIEVAFGCDAEQVWIAVRDNGPGVPPEHLARVADLFFTTKDPGRGTGLGLALVHRLIASHGGSVDMSNLPGGGFEVVLRVPRDAGASGAPAASQGGASPSGASPGGAS